MGHTEAIFGIELLVFAYRGIKIDTAVRQGTVHVKGDESDFREAFKYHLGHGTVAGMKQRLTLRHRGGRVSHDERGI